MEQRRGTLRTAGGSVVEPGRRVGAGKDGRLVGMAGGERRRGDALDDPVAHTYGPPGRGQEICVGAGIAVGTLAAGEIDWTTKEREDKGITEKIMGCVPV